MMIVYDITSEKSFDNVHNWIRIVEENAPANVSCNHFDVYIILSIPTSKIGHWPGLRD